MGNGPRVPLAAPARRPPRRSLLATARLLGAVVEGPTDADGARWGAGLAYEPEVCSSGGVVDPCGTDAKAIEDPPPLVEVEPFGVWAGYRCSTFGHAAQDYEGRARRALAACESAHVAAELWRGDEARANGWPNAFLASLDSDVVASAADPIEALACLDEAIAGCGCGTRGMIHATAQVATWWFRFNLVRIDGGLVLTNAYDTVVVIDGGYDGSGPPGAPGGAPTPAANGSIWAYASDPVTVYLDDVTVTPANDVERAASIDHSVNTVEVRAERLAAVSFDRCCLFAAEMDLSLCTVGGPGS